MAMFDSLRTRHGPLARDDGGSDVDAPSDYTRELNFYALGHHQESVEYVGP